MNRNSPHDHIPNKDANAPTGSQPGGIPHNHWVFSQQCLDWPFGYAHMRYCPKVSYLSIMEGSIKIYYIWFPNKDSGACSIAPDKDDAKPFACHATYNCLWNPNFFQCDKGQSFCPFILKKRECSQYQFFLCLPV
jgi:hypothetical protein